MRRDSTSAQTAGGRGGGMDKAQPQWIECPGMKRRKHVREAVRAYDTDEASAGVEQGRGGANKEGKGARIAEQRLPTSFRCRHSSCFFQPPRRIGENKSCPAVAVADGRGRMRPLGGGEIDRQRGEVTLQSQVAGIAPGCRYKLFIPVESIAERFR